MYVVNQIFQNYDPVGLWEAEEVVFGQPVAEKSSSVCYWPKRGRVGRRGRCRGVPTLFGQPAAEKRSLRPASGRKGVFGQPAAEEVGLIPTEPERPPSSSSVRSSSLSLVSLSLSQPRVDLLTGPSIFASNPEKE